MTAVGLALASASALAGTMGDVADLPDTKAVAQKDFTGMLGVAALSRPEYIGSNENETIAVPLVKLDYKDTVYFKFNRAGVWFWKPANTDLRFGALVKSRRGWDDSDDKRLQGMGERDDSIEAGLNMAWRYDRADVELGYLTDVSDKSDGDSAFINFGYNFMQSQAFVLRGQLNFEYLDDDVTNYYWGVPGSKATASRPKYSPDEAWNTSVGLIGTYSMTESWVLMGGAIYTMLGDEIDDSPIVKEDNYTTAFIGVGWKF